MGLDISPTAIAKALLVTAVDESGYHAYEQAFVRARTVPEESPWRILRVEVKAHVARKARA
jgi:hypothetical protein